MPNQKEKKKKKLTVTKSLLETPSIHNHLKLLSTHFYVQKEISLLSFGKKIKIKIKAICGVVLILKNIN